MAERQIFDINSIGAKDSDSIGTDCYVSEKGIQALPVPFNDAMQTGLGEFKVTFYLNGKPYHIFEKGILNMFQEQQDVEVYIGTEPVASSIAFKDIKTVSYFTVTNNEFTPNVAGGVKFKVYNNILAVLDDNTVLFIEEDNESNDNTESDKSITIVKAGITVDSVIERDLDEKGVSKASITAYTICYAVGHRNDNYVYNAYFPLAGSVKLKTQYEHKYDNMRYGSVSTILTSTFDPGTWTSAYTDTNDVVRNIEPIEYEKDLRAFCKIIVECSDKTKIDRVYLQRYYPNSNTFITNIEDDPNTLTLDGKEFTKQKSLGAYFRDVDNEDILYTEDYFGDKPIINNMPVRYVEVENVLLKSKTPTAYAFYITEEDIKGAVSIVEQKISGFYHSVWTLDRLRNGFENLGGDNTDIDYMKWGSFREEPLVPLTFYTANALWPDYYPRKNDINEEIRIDAYAGEDTRSDPRHQISMKFKTQKYTDMAMDTSTISVQGQFFNDNDSHTGAFYPFCIIEQLVDIRDIFLTPRQPPRESYHSWSDNPWPPRNENANIDQDRRIIDKAQGENKATLIQNTEAGTAFALRNRMFYLEPETKFYLSQGKQFAAKSKTSIILPFAYGREVYRGNRGKYTDEVRSPEWFYTGRYKLIDKNLDLSSMDNSKLVKLDIRDFNLTGESVEVQEDQYTSSMNNAIYFTDLSSFHVNYTDRSYVIPSNIANRIVGLYGEDRNIYSIGSNGIEVFQISDVDKSPLNWIAVDQTYDKLIDWNGIEKFTILTKNKSDYYLNGVNRVRQDLFTDWSKLKPTLTIKGFNFHVIDTTGNLLLVDEQLRAFRANTYKYIWPITIANEQNIFANKEGNIVKCAIENNESFNIEFYYRAPKNVIIDELTIETANYDNNIGEDNKKEYTLWKTNSTGRSRLSNQLLVTFYKLGRSINSMFTIFAQGYLKGVSVKETQLGQKAGE